MDTTKYIQNLTKIYIVCTIFILVLGFSFEDQLPELLQQYNDQIAIGGPPNMLFAWFGLFVIIAHLISLYGLVTVKKWSKSLFLYTILLSLSLVFFMGSHVADAISDTVETISILVSGAILALLYLTPSDFTEETESRGFTGKPTNSKE